MTWHVGEDKTTIKFTNAYNLQEDANNIENCLLSFLCGEISLVEKPKIGIDLIPIHFRHKCTRDSATCRGTGTSVVQDGLALAVGSVIAPSRQTLYSEISYLHPHILSVNKRSIYATFQIGKTWRSAGCSLGFCYCLFCSSR